MNRWNQKQDDRLSTPTVRSAASTNRLASGVVNEPLDIPVMFVATTPGKTDCTTMPLPPYSKAKLCEN